MELKQIESLPRACLFGKVEKYKWARPDEEEAYDDWCKYKPGSIWVRFCLWKSDEQSLHMFASYRRLGRLDIYSVPPFGAADWRGSHCGEEHGDESCRTMQTVGHPMWVRIRGSKMRDFKGHLELSKNLKGNSYIRKTKAFTSPIEPIIPKLPLKDSIEWPSGLDHWNGLSRGPVESFVAEFLSESLVVSIYVGWFCCLRFLIMPAFNGCERSLWVSGLMYILSVCYKLVWHAVHDGENGGEVVMIHINQWVKFSLARQLFPNNPKVLCHSAKDHQNRRFCGIQLQK